MGKFSKLWGTIGGSLVGIVFSSLAIYGLATCTNDADVSTCTVLGMGPTTISMIITAVVSALGTYIAPANTPS